MHLIRGSAQRFCKQASIRVLGRIASLIAIALLAAAFFTVGPSSALAVEKGASGLPLPRYVSLKSSRVNMRIGPGRDYKVQWLYVKRGLPMEIIQEYDNWRKVRDPEGNEGWILHSLLSGERTAIVAPWDRGGEMITVHSQPDRNALLAARLEPGVLATVGECEGGWCSLRVRGVRGFVRQTALWGVYPGESF